MLLTLAEEEEEVVVEEEEEEAQKITRRRRRSIGKSLSLPPMEKTNTSKSETKSNII